MKDPESSLAVRGEQIVGAKVSFTILGQPASLKNSRQAVMVGPKNDKRMMYIPSEAALQYKADWEKQFPAKVRVMLQGPVKVHIRIFYRTELPDLDEALILDLMAPKYTKQKGKLIKQQNGEYAEGPAQRVMIRKGVYENDRQVREKHIYHSIDPVNPRAEIEVEQLVPAGDFFSNSGE